jgi:ribosomal protein S18 acetylase RimI-like enzyme
VIAPSAVIVRDATGDDAQEIERIRIRGWQVAYRHLYPPEELDGLAIDASRWRHRIDHPPRGWTIIVAGDAGSLLGFASTGPSRDERGVGELYAIYVDPDAWSRGAGRALLAHAEERLAATYAEATLWVLEGNTRARRFYEAAGWQPDGARQAVERLGVSPAEVRYRKRLVRP